MGVYLINESDMVGIADAVRAKTGKTKKISFDNIVSEIASISGGVDLNFNVVGGLEQPTNPTENMIWIETNEEITKWIFSSSEPNAPEEGMVWIYTGIDSHAAFNVLKENMIQVYPLSAKLFINNKWNSYGVNIYKEGQWLTLNTIPEFTYTGNYAIVNDNDEAITSSKDNWKIKFLTSGTLTFINLNGAGAGIDVFCVGGGGGGGTKGSNNIAGGGGGGYTTTGFAIPEKKTDYEIIVGAGGGADANGGESSAFGVSANGGVHGYGGGNGGNGGSGGGSGSTYGGEPNAYGGSDGSNGATSAYGSGGTGQGTTTREFGEEGATLYAGGGGGGVSYGSNHGGAGGGGAGSNNNAHGTPGTVNTGGGGGGGKYGGNPGSGGSGIVIIRNARG